MSRAHATDSRKRWSGHLRTPRRTTTPIAVFPFASICELRVAPHIRRHGHPCAFAAFAALGCALPAYGGKADERVASTSSAAGTTSDAGMPVMGSGGTGGSRSGAAPGRVARATRELLRMPDSPWTVGPALRAGFSGRIRSAGPPGYERLAVSAPAVGERRRAIAFVRRFTRRLASSHEPWCGTKTVSPPGSRSCQSDRRSRSGRTLSPRRRKNTSGR